MHLLSQLVEKNIVQYGDFTLKSGEKSNIYVNLKNLVSHPQLMAGLCVYISKMMYPKSKDYALCGVPMGGIPLATTLSMLTSKPQIILRKDRKAYGMKKQVEGDGNVRDIVLIEDVVTTGSSVKEAIGMLYEEGYNVIQVVSIVYRGRYLTSEWLKDLNYTFIFHINEFNPKYKRKAILGRPITLQPKATELYERIQRKKTNIVLAYDIGQSASFSHLLKMLDIVYPHIIGLKIHNEILGLSWDENIQLYIRCSELDIFLWEDRKFNDIGNTIQKQIKFYEPIRDYVSVVPTSGKKSLYCETTLGKFVLCEMSSSDNLFNPLTTNNIVSMLDDPKINIAGLICQSPELFNLGIPSLMPGINLKKGTDDLGQKWRNPETLQTQPTMYVIGRAITESEDMEKELIKYKKIFKKII